MRRKLALFHYLSQYFNTYGGENNIFTGVLQLNLKIQSIIELGDDWVAIFFIKIIF